MNTLHLLTEFLESNGCHLNADDGYIENDGQIMMFKPIFADGKQVGNYPVLIHSISQAAMMLEHVDFGG